MLFLIGALKVAREYERGIVFRLGRLLPEPKGPGLFFLIPIVDRMVKVDLRTITLNIPPQEVITKDNVPVRVNAVAYFRIVDPKAAIVQIENYMVATSQIAQTTLRSVLGQHSLDELLSEREKINAILQGIIDEQTAPWGIKVSIVEVKDVEIPQGMQRAMARQAEAERERRAKVINAEGEFQASERLKDAALVIEEHPIALQLRYLQTLLELGSSQSTTIVFPAPIDIISSFLPKRRRRRPATSARADLRRSPWPLLAEAAGRVDRGAEVQALVLRLLDQHHGLDRVHVVDPLLLALGRDLRLVRPVVELHLRDAARRQTCPRYSSTLSRCSARSTGSSRSTCFEYPMRSGPPSCCGHDGSARRRSRKRKASRRRRRLASSSLGSSAARAPSALDGHVARSVRRPRRRPPRPSMTGASDETISPSRSRITITPCVERPSRLTSSTGILITVPPVEISITW